MDNDAFAAFAALIVALMIFFTIAAMYKERVEIMDDCIKSGMPKPQCVEIMGVEIVRPLKKPD